MLTELTVTKQVEVVFVNGAPAYVFREAEKQVLRDSKVVAATPHRESYPMGSVEAIAIFGDILSASLMQTEALTAQVDGLTAQVRDQASQILTLQVQLAAAAAP